jgi:hypothetical protein
MMKTIKNIKGVKPLPKQQQQKVNGGTAAMETSESSAEDTSKPRPPLLIIAG